VSDAASALAPSLDLGLVAASAQLVGASLQAATLLYLARLQRRPHAHAWALGWLSLTAALFAALLHVATGRWWFRVPYLLLEWAFVGLLALGCATFAGVAGPWRRGLALAAAPALVAALLLARMPGSFNRLFAIQAALLAFGYLSALSLLLRQPPAERSDGARLMAGVLLALTLLFLAYVPAYSRPELAGPWLALSSLADLFLQTLLGIGQLLALSSESQRALEREREQLAGLVERLPLPLLLLREGRILFANAAAGRLLERPPEKLQGELLPGQPPAASAGAPPGLRDVALLRADGAQVLLEAAPVQPLVWCGEEAQLLAGLDVTDRRKLESVLLRTERLHALGALSGGAAHALNNPLAGLIGNLELAQLDLPHDAPDYLRESLVQATHSAERLRRIVGDLVALTRSSSERRPVVVASVARTALRLCGPGLAEKARVLDGCGGVARVLASEPELAQAILALLLNAAQAIGPGAPAANEIALRTLDRDQEAVVEVSDTGRGIPPEQLPRIFDPFFTTTPSGTGLGLTLCHATVAAIGGRLEVESTVGKGTTFRMRLPIDRSQPVLQSLPAPQAGA
jgi:signal transduction histidine kinase